MPWCMSEPGPNLGTEAALERLDGIVGLKPVKERGPQPKLGQAQTATVRAI